MSKDDFAKQDFQTVLSWMLPAFPMVKNKQSIGPISVACMSLLANACKRKGPIQWNEPLEEKLEAWNLIHGEETYDELRLNLTVVGEPGSGKSAILTGISRLNPYSVCFRQSTPHYDQLIGSTEKWQEGGKWKYEPFPGELSSDFVIMDEVLSVYTFDSSENRKIRELLRGTLSRIGTNKISKPQVRIPESFHCSYYPECTLVQGFPARKVPMSIMTEGDIRRSQIICVNFPLSEKETTKRFGTNAPGKQSPKPKNFVKAVNYLRYLRQRNYDFWLSESTMDYVKSCMHSLKDFSAMHGPKPSWMFKIAYFDIETQLIRYSTIMSIIRDSQREVIDIAVDDVKKAFPIFSTAYADSVIWVNRYTNDDYSVLPMKTKNLQKTEKVLKYLKSKGAFSYLETVVGVTELKKVMVQRGWFSNEAGVKRFYQDLLKYGIVKSKKKGKSWVVWIGPLGQEYLENQEVSVPWD